MIFLKKTKRSKEPNLLDLLHKIPEDEQEPEAAETTILDALEDEMKKAKIIEPESEPKPEPQPKSQPKMEAKSEEKKIQIEIIESEPEKPEVPKEVTPVFREDNSHPEYYRILIGVPGVNFDEVQSHISPEKDRNKFWYGKTLFILEIEIKKKYIFRQD